MKNNFSAQAVKNHAANYWRSETASVLSRYTDLLSAFKGNVDKLLESFWKQRKKNVEKYILTLSIHEKALLEEQRAQNEEYRNLQRQEKILKAAVSELQDLQKSYLEFPKESIKNEVKNGGKQNRLPGRKRPSS